MAPGDQSDSGRAASERGAAGPQPAAASPLAPEGERPLTLEQLSGALAQMLGVTPDQAEGGADSEPAVGQPKPSRSADDESCPVTPRSILEAMLFVGHPANEPLRPEQASELIRDTSSEEIVELVDELNQIYASEGAPYSIEQQGEGYRLSLREEYRPIRRRFHGRTSEARLSQAAIEVLALVAYNQPTTSRQISDLRGHPSTQILSQLVRRQLLRVERSSQQPRTPMYCTTPRFLKLFGLSGLDELPQAKEFDQ